MNIYLLFPIIFFFGVVQSIFGVGLLLFGTPTLLLMNYTFTQCLGILLPCSIAVNLIQVARHWRLVSIKRDFILFCVPFVILGLTIVLYRGRGINSKKVVGILLLATALLRLSDKSRAVLQQVFRRTTRPALMLLGFVHGISNMGGGLLTILVSSLHAQKWEVRANIAFGYLLMALVQILVLVVHGMGSFFPAEVILVITAIGAYGFVGRRLFWVASENAYQLILNAFIVAFGLVLFLF
jgi:uncharacterized protein